jgi:cysteinyl-tRNA synthetase
VQFFNTLTRRKEEFRPLHKSAVRIYNCGPTVYTFAHIGNFRTFIFDDLLRRYLEYKGYEVKQVMNITDVGHMTLDDEEHLEGDTGEDKLERQAALEKKDPWRLARFYTEAFMEDFKALRLREPTAFPRATEHIPDMIEMVQGLIDKGYAYVVDGEVLYDISKFPAYGKLSGNTLENLKAGARVEVNPKKRTPFDFHLWKNDPGHIMQWPSPWNEHGFPGWHIECSVMSMKYLGDMIDIHTGGEDNIFPHHENEIAQSEAFTGGEYVRYWLHARHLLVNGEKMSKSKGNFYTVRDLFAKGYDGPEVRYALMSVHYRQNLNFTFEGLDDGRRAIRRLRDFMANLDVRHGPGTEGRAAALCEKAAREFEEAMDDDLNIAPALGAVFNFVRDVNRLGDDVSVEEAARAKAVMMRFDEVLAVIHKERAEMSQEFAEKIKQREEARKARDFATADAIRDWFAQRGYELEDTSHGTRWKPMAGTKQQENRRE